MEKILQTYLRRLTNLSGNNRSLLLLRLYVDQFIDLHDFDFLDKNPSFQIIHQLIAGNPRIKLCSRVDPRDHQSNEVSTRLKKIQRVEKFIFQERGGKDLYVGWPFIRGRLMDGTLVRGPLLFFPVELELDGNDWYLRLRKEVNLTFNKSFLLAYSYYNQIALEEDLIERVFDDFDRESKAFRTSLYHLIKDSPLKVNFNPEIFVDQLIPFKEFKKVDFEEKHQNGELKLFPEAVLGIFPQSGSYLVPDYVHLIEKGKYNSLDDFFSERSFSDESHEENRHLSFFYFLNKIKEEQTFTPFKMDAFQENAIKAVKKGNSIVVQGPPGTGKSQLICNLISDFISSGKRVLVVCQKRAALDVVYERLEEEDIADFTALVHDFKNDRKQIYQQIHAQIEKLYEYKLKNNSLDSIQLERKFLHASRTIDRLAEELDELKFALYDESECGLSVKELYLTSDPGAPTINLKQHYNFFKFNELQPFTDKLRYYILYAKRFQKEAYPWRKRKNFKDLKASDLNNILGLIDDISVFQQRLITESEKIVNTEVSFQEGEAILKNREEIDRMLELLSQVHIYEYFQHIMGNVPKNAEHLYVSNIEQNITNCFIDPGIETSLKSNELGKFQITLHRMLEARRNPRKWIRWLIFSKDRPLIRRVLARNRLRPKKKDLKILTRRLDNRLNFEHNITKLKGNPWITGLPSNLSLDEMKIWFDDFKKAIIAKDIFMKVRGFPDYFNIPALSYEEFEGSGKALLKLLSEIPAKRLAWEKYLLPTQIQEILSGRYEPSRLKNVINNDFESLCDFDRIQHDLLDHEEGVVSRIDEILEDYPEEQVMEIFQNSLRISWIDHIETKYPVLRVVSSLKIDPMIKELQESVKEKLDVSKEIVLMKARERTYGKVEYNRLHNMTTYRDLTHQITKKRKIWPIRKLISIFSSELFNLIPCWMTSPESASAIFPMEKLFDIVIFDEASQCFVERGIPAMYRGKQVMIAGDANQLSPFDLYKVRWEEESEDIPELEVDSLLDLAEKYLMQVHLRGHYRSKTLDLIDFSNRNFYKGNLTLIPDRHLLNRKNPAITFKKVDGIWEDNRNEIEAHAVIDQVFEILKKTPEKELGIVTFNARQQDLILDLMEERTIESKVSIPETLFVKNIENVQGDERDIIIFSLTHGPDTKGNLSMQFGTLNVIKGENRLNVAVTRAKEKIYLLASFYPHQMNTEHLKNEGPRLLKNYLEYAVKVSEGEYTPSLQPRLKSSSSWYLKDRLMNDLRDEKRFVMEVSQELPFADLTLKRNESYYGLILTDDDLYYQSVSSKEAQVYDPLNLTTKNWKFRSVFSREYWQDKARIIDRLALFSNHLVR